MKYRPVTANARAILVAPLSSAAVDAIRAQLAPVITPVEKEGQELNFGVKFDDINDYVGIGQDGPSNQQELEKVVENAVSTALEMAGVTKEAIAELTVSDVEEHEG